MATEIIDNLRGPKDAACNLLRELIDTPMLVELEFTFRMRSDAIQEAEYVVRRLIDPCDNSGGGAK